MNMMKVSVDIAMHNALRLAPAQRVKAWVRDIAVRKQELKHSIRQSKKRLSFEGKPISEGSAEQYRFKAKRDLCALIAIEDCLKAILNMCDYIDEAGFPDQGWARFKMTASGFKGLERLLYPGKKVFGKPRDEDSDAGDEEERQHMPEELQGHVGIGGFDAEGL